MSSPSSSPSTLDSAQLGSLRQWLDGEARAIGFDDVRVTDTHLGEATNKLREWLAAGRHGHMEYMQRHAALRSDPQLLLPGTTRVICVRMNYVPPEVDFEQEWQRLAQPDQAVVSIYARGRDYHKILRQRLQDFAKSIEAKIGSFGYRVFTDSAPLMEVELARKAGLGWRGKHTLLLNREAGSTFFLGEILVDIPLPLDTEIEEHCGSCSACIDICPTQAITAPYALDARRCISYLTIENPDLIPIEFRKAMGNRVYGCDDCQLYCPWNKFAQSAAVDDFEVRNGLDHARMVHLLLWSEGQFLRMLEGSPIRRIGHERWLRNIAVGLGNAACTMRGDAEIVAALTSRLTHPSEMVREHVQWALEQHGQSS